MDRNTVQTLDSTVQAFLDAAELARGVLAEPAVGDAWGRRSALERMDVGALAGHLYLVLRRVNKHLEAQPVTDNSVSSPRVETPTMPAAVTRLPTIRVDDVADLDAEVHVRVRADGQRVAERGWASITESFAVDLASLTDRLVDAPATIVPLGATAPIALEPYLASRVAELLVHADDLALSVGLVLLTPDAATVSVALGFLIDSAREVHGDLAVLRAFTRRERTPLGIPAVY